MYFLLMKQPWLELEPSSKSIQSSSLVKFYERIYKTSKDKNTMSTFPFVCPRLRKWFWSVPLLPVTVSSRYSASARIRIGNEALELSIFLSFGNDVHSLAWRWKALCVLGLQYTCSLWQAFLHPTSQCCNLSISLWKILSLRISSFLLDTVL